MPLVTVTVTPSDRPDAVARATDAIRRVGAAAFACPRDNIWVVFHVVPRLHYVQTDADGSGPLVEIKANAGRGREQREALVAGVAHAIADHFGGDPGRVWIHYQELDPSYVWQGPPRG